MRSVWLLREGQVLAAGEVATTYFERARGCLGRRGLDGALVLEHTKAVHSLGMRFALDVAFLDREMKVLEIVTVNPWRFGRPRLRARSVLEAQRGAFERWGLGVGDIVELRDVT